MSLQTAPVAPASIPHGENRLPPALCSFMLVISVCFEVFLGSGLATKPLLSLHPASQTWIASKPGFKQFSGRSRVAFV